MTLPEIEKGIPLPEVKRDGRNRPRSYWPDFIKQLEPEDSFVATYSRGVTVLNIAKWMGIKLIYKDIGFNGSRRMMRIWKV